MDQKVYDDIMSEIAATCETCPLRTKCPEDTCPLWNIEQTCVNAVDIKGTYQCFHCLSNSVVWQADFSFEDYGLEDEGIINVCHCSNCDADIEYFVPLDDNND